MLISYFILDVFSSDLSNRLALLCSPSESVAPALRHLSSLGSEIGFPRTRNRFAISHLKTRYTFCIFYDKSCAKDQRYATYNRLLGNAATGRKEACPGRHAVPDRDRKSTRLNSSH